MKKIPVVDYGAVQSTYNTNNNIEELHAVHNGGGILSETQQILNGEVIFKLLIDLFSLRVKNNTLKGNNFINRRLKVKFKMMT